MVKCASNRSRPRSARARCGRVAEGLDDRGGQRGLVADRYEERALARDLTRLWERGRDDRRLQREGFDGGSGHALASGREGEHICRTQEVGHVVPFPEDPHTSGRVDASARLEDAARRVSLASRDQELCAGPLLQDVVHRRHQDVEVLRRLVTPDGQDDLLARLDAETGADLRPARLGAPPQRDGVTAPGDHVDPVQRVAQARAHRGLDLLRHRMQPGGQSGAERVESLRGSEPRATDAGLPGVLGPVGLGRKGRHDRYTGDPRCDPSGHVGLEEGGVDQVRPAGPHELRDALDPSHAVAGRVQGDDRRAGRLDLLAQPGPIPEHDDLEVDPEVPIRTREGGQRTLRSPRGEAVDDVEDPQRRQGVRHRRAMLRAFVSFANPRGASPCSASSPVAPASSVPH